MGRSHMQRLSGEKARSSYSQGSYGKTGDSPAGSGMDDRPLPSSPVDALRYIRRDPGASGSGPNSRDGHFFFSTRLHSLTGRFCIVDFQTSTEEVKSESTFSSVGIEHSVEPAHLLTLDPDPEVVWSKKIKKDNRRLIRKAIKSGTRISLEMDEGAFDILFELVEKSRERWGRRSGYSKEFIRALRFDGSELRIARVEGIPVGALLAFRDEDQLILWLMGSRKEYWGYGVNYILIWDAIESSCGKKLRYLNLGASGGLEGVRLFKKKFGGEEHPVYVRALEGKVFSRLKSLRAGKRNQG